MLPPLRLLLLLLLHLLLHYSAPSVLLQAKRGRRTKEDVELATNVSAACTFLLQQLLIVVGPFSVAFVAFVAAVVVVAVAFLRKSSDELNLIVNLCVVLFLL